MCSIQALLFDLGGVVIDIDFDRMLRHWLPHSRLTLAQMRERLQADELYCRHERGEIDAARYMAHLREVFALDAEPQTVTAGWNAMLVDEIPETLELVEHLAPRLPCYAFSNTSAVHHAEWGPRFPRVSAAFEQLFLSFQLGLRKPDREAYHAVAREIETDPGSILFFDDTEENVTGAHRAGLDAVLVRRPDDIVDALTQRGLYVPPHANP
jgi:FMN phosphatase YigB (HAD superfamily)